MSTKKLVSKYQYSNSAHGLFFSAGQMLEVSEATAEFLARDAPGCFEPVFRQPEPEDKEIEAPPKDKMVRRRSTKKK